MRLIDAPVGLLNCDGTIILKTEYSTPHTIDCETKIFPECYIVESGEYFWGGVDSVEARNNLEVTPVEMPTLIPQDEPLTIEQLREMDGQPVWIVDIGNRKWYGPSWAIVDREANLVRTVKNWNAVFFEIYGKQWIAYRRPPEEDCE